MKKSRYNYLIQDRASIENIRDALKGVDKDHLDRLMEDILNTIHLNEYKDNLLAKDMFLMGYVSAHFEYYNE